MADLNEMVVFARVVEANSFTGAARVLTMPKSTVSRRVSELEERLGVQLLYRTSRSVRLTEIGAEYYTHCSRIADAVEVADMIVDQRQLVPQGKLVVSSPVPSGRYLFDNVFGRFMEEFPRVEMELRIDSGDGAVLEADVDVAIRNGPLPDSDLIAKPIGAVRYFLCATPEYLDKYGTPAAIEDFQRHHLIRDASEVNAQVWTVSKEGETFLIPLEGRLVVPSPAQLHQATVAHLGISKLPIYLCNRGIRQGRLVRLLPEYRFADETMYLVYRNSKIQPMKLAVLIDHISKVFSKNAPWERD